MAFYEFFSVDQHPGYNVGPMLGLPLGPMPRLPLGPMPRWPYGLLRFSFCGPTPGL